MVKENEFNERLIELILQEGRLEEEDNNLLMEYLIAIQKLKNWHVPYDLISSKVYEMNRDNIASSIREKFDYVLLQRSSNEERLDEGWLNELRDDIIRDVNLALVQREYIDKSINGVVKKANRINNRIKRMQKTIRKNIEEAQDIKKNIYTDFITILGIFTAISFSAFGGLKLISGALGNFKGTISREGLGMILVVSAIILLSTYLILVALLTGISKLISFIRDEEKEYHFTTGLTCLIVLSISILLIVGVIMFIS